MKNNFSVLYPMIMGNHLYQFFGSMKIHGTHLNFSKSYIFFLALDRRHKPVTCNALWELFKMADNRKLIDAKQPLSFINKPSHNYRIVLLLKNLSGKIGGNLTWSQQCSKKFLPLSDQAKTKVKSFAKSHNHTQIVNSQPITRSSCNTHKQ